MTTILRAVTGSTAYGLAHSESDIDRLGVFVAPTLDVAGLSWHSSKESNVSQGPGQDDWAEHEIGKYLRLALKVNPTISEILWLPLVHYEVFTPEGRALTEIRESFLSRRCVLDSYMGYAKSQLAKYRGNVQSTARDGLTSVKSARHCLRLVEQGRGLYMTGVLQPRVAKPQRYFDLAEMKPEQVLKVLTDAIDEWPTLYSPLPEKPDTDTVRDFLSDVRRNHME